MCEMYAAVNWNAPCKELRNIASWQVMPGLRDAARVYVDGELTGSVIFPPYRVPLSLSAGKHHIRIQAANTLGNTLEGFLAPSGLTERPYIEF